MYLIYTGEILEIPDQLKGISVQLEPKKETQELEKPAVSNSTEEKDLLDRLVEADAKGA